MKARVRDKNMFLQDVSVTDTATAGVCMHGRCFVIERELVRTMRDRKFGTQINQHSFVRAVERSEVVRNVLATSLFTLHVSLTCMGNAVITAAIGFQIAVST